MEIRSPLRPRLSPAGLPAHLVLQPETIILYQFSLGDGVLVSSLNYRRQPRTFCTPTRRQYTLRCRGSCNPFIAVNKSGTPSLTRNERPFSPLCVLFDPVAVYDLPDWWILHCLGPPSLCAAQAKKGKLVDIALSLSSKSVCRTS